jgi:hypothetical protein
MKLPSPHISAGGISAPDNVSTLHLSSQPDLFRVDGYSTQRGTGRRTRYSSYAKISEEVWALDAKDALAQAKALHPDLSEWARVSKYAPVTMYDFDSVRWENFNQAERECVCIAVMADKGAGLFAYQMPAGKVFMFTLDAFGENKSVSFRGLSKAWVEAFWTCHGLPPDRAIWFTPEGKLELREAILSGFDDGKLGLYR